MVKVKNTSLTVFYSQMLPNDIRMSHVVGINGILSHLFQTL